MSDNKRRTPNFRVGQIVHHKRFGYRGVIVDAHAHYEEASSIVGRSSPSPADRRRPWYEILVHNRSIETFEAESNLEVDESKAPINHPYVPVFFNEFEDGTYRVGGIDN
jgi:heat shock protein HspQ